METKNRDISFDNLKGIMIFLVVFCHTIEKLVPQWAHFPVVRWLYFLIYSFHMPVFIFISGRFSKGPGNRVLRGALTGCLIPYILFQILYGLLFFSPRAGLTETILSVFDLAVPRWTMWYLLSLFCWKIMAEPFSLFRFPLVTAVLLSLYIGMTDAGTFLSIARTFSFFPYFLAGYLVSDDLPEKIRSKGRPRYILLMAAAIGLITLVDLSGSQIGNLRMSQPYTALSLPIWKAAILRMGLLIIGFFFIASFIALVGNRKTAVTVLGANCMSVYLLHSGLIRLLGAVGIITFSDPVAAIAGSAVISLLICALLGNTWVHGAVRSTLRCLGSVLTLKQD